MRTTDYTIELEALKSALRHLDQEELVLNDALQTYQQGLKHHERCVNTLAMVEQRMKESSQNVDVEPVELSLKDVFTSLENVEQSIEELPESKLEDCVDLLVQAERILAAGYQQLNRAEVALSSATEKNTHPAVSNPCSEEVRRV